MNDFMQTVFWGMSGIAVLLHVWFKWRSNKALWTIVLHLRAIHHLSDIHDLALNINRATMFDSGLSAESVRHVREWSAGILNHAKQ